ncbi:MAG: hypothetical protein NZL96_01000 [Patescibacteria group bacterium]|nr:hypothetical protein [Patescibacteria group bacterium]
MPRKTKKEKIIAEYRKRLKLISQRLSQPNKNNSERKEIYSKDQPSLCSKVPKLNQQISPKDDNQDSKVTKKYLYQDLKKTIILSLIIFVIQIILAISIF